MGSRQRRLRSEIKDNLSLVEEIEKHDLLRDHTFASAWLQGRITVDVARLTGTQLGTPKAPVPKASVTLAVIIGVAFSLWTALIDRDGFVWYSVFPATVALLMLMSIAGMVTNRELPPEETELLPPGAVLARTETASEQIATSVAVAASGGLDERFAPGGQVDVVLRFLQLLRLGQYEAGITLADETWIRCRVQSWLWNNQDHFGDDLDRLDQLTEAMLA